MPLGSGAASPNTHANGCSRDRHPPITRRVTLIALDSLTRIHTQDENAAGAMSALHNDGIKPLARDTGAAVIIIHHTNKGQGSAYTRARGSTDIVYAMDAGIDVRPSEPMSDASAE